MRQKLYALVVRTLRKMHERAIDWCILRLFLFLLRYAPTSILRLLCREILVEISERLTAEAAKIEPEQRPTG
jgi:hypothetical protein